MSYILLFAANCIIIFIAYVVLNGRIRKNSASGVLERYTKEVENLIVELNSALDDAVNVSEEKVKDLKKVIAAAEKTLKKPAVKKALAAGWESDVPSAGVNTAATPNSYNVLSQRLPESDNLLEKTRHLKSMGYSKEDISRILKIQRAEVDFLESIGR